MLKKLLIAVACISMLSFAAEDPVEAIKKKDAELQALLKKSSRNVKETERVNVGKILNKNYLIALVFKIAA